MSKAGKFLLLFAVMFLLGGYAWFQILPPENSQVKWLPLVLFLVLFTIFVIRDRAFVLEFLTLRTTRHGMNMGTLILLVLAVLACVNYVAVKRDVKWDMTEEKLNSLAPQSAKIVRGLKEELKIRGFFMGGQDQRNQGEFEGLVEMLKSESSKVHIEIWNPQKRPDLAKKYGVQYSSTAVLEYKGKQSQVTEFSEEAMVNAILKLTRDKRKIVYSLVGHGEIALANEKPRGGALLKKELESSSYEVRDLSLVEKITVPEDASVLMILGPQNPLLKPELNALMDYIKSGGKVLLAGDPGTDSNLGVLFGDVGLQFDNNYIIDQMGQIVGLSAAVAIGIGYSKTSPVTKEFGSGMTVFPLASSLSKVAKANANFKYDEILKSSPASFTRKELSSKVTLTTDDKRGPFAIGYTVEGRFSEDPKDQKFYVAAFGDSDFLSNQSFNMQLNRDLSLNTLSFLAQDEDLISIRPKQAKGTMLTMTEIQTALMVFGLLIPLPLIFLISGSVIWYRRRHA